MKVPQQLIDNLVDQKTIELINCDGVDLDEESASRLVKSIVNECHNLCQLSHEEQTMKSEEEIKEQIKRIEDMDRPEYDLYLTEGEQGMLDALYWVLDQKNRK